VFWALFAVLIGASDSVYFRFVVRFCMVCGALQHGYAWLLSMLGSLAEREML
jgi:hypothetical protein